MKKLVISLLIAVIISTTNGYIGIAIANAQTISQEEEDEQITWLFKDLGDAIQKFNQHPDQKDVLDRMGGFTATARDSFPALKFAYLYKNTPGSQTIILKAARRLAEEGHWSALAYAHHYKDLPNGKEILELAVKNSSKYDFLKYFENYKSLPDSYKILEKVLDFLLFKRHTTTVLENIDKYIDQPYAERIIEAAAEQHIGDTLRTLYPYNNSDKKKVIFRKIFEKIRIKDIDWLFGFFGNNYYSRPEIIRELAAAHPAAALRNFSHYNSLPNADQILKKAIEDCLQKYPGDLLRHLWSYKELPGSEMILKTAAENSAEHDPVAALKEVETYIDKSYAKETIEAAIKRLRQLSNQEEINEVLSTFSLQVVEKLNRLHNEPEDKRFSTIDNFDAELTYLLMVYGEEEIYTSTFNGLLDRFLKKLKQENLDGHQFLQKVGYNRFRTFFKLDASFNRLNDFLQTMPEKSRQELLEKFIKNIEESLDPISEVVTIAETLNVMQDSTILQSLQETIKSEYGRLVKEDRKNLVILYGLLASMSADNVLAEEILGKYRLQITEIPSADLFNAQNTNIQQYLFYNDKDGLSSFAHFLSQYQNEPAWQIYEHDTYVLIESIADNKGRVKIYANKPGKLEEAKSILLEKNVVPTIIVHRGHSYHLWRTLEEVTQKTKLVILGSCGGYNAIDKILRKSLSVQVLTTKGVMKKLLKAGVFTGLIFGKKRRRNLKEKMILKIIFLPIKILACLLE